MLKEDAIIKTRNWRGHSHALDLRGARRKFGTPSHNI